MCKNQKISEKMIETREKIITATLMMLVGLGLEIMVAMQLGNALKGVDALRFTLGVIVIGLLCGLCACKVYWLCDYINATLRQLKNVIDVVLLSDEDIDYVGNTERKENGEDHIENIEEK